MTTPNCSHCADTAKLLQGMAKDLALMNARMTKLGIQMKGGSIASDYVMSNVSPAVFNAMDANFTNVVEEESSMSGGGGDDDVENQIEEFDLVSTAKSFLEAAMTKPFTLKGGNGESKQVTVTDLIVQAADVVEKYQPLAKGWFDLWKAKHTSTVGGSSEPVKLELSDILPLVEASKGILNKVMNGMSHKAALGIASVLSTPDLFTAGDSIDTKVASIATPALKHISPEILAVLNAMVHAYGTQAVETAKPFLYLEKPNLDKLAIIGGGMPASAEAWMNALPEAVKDASWWIWMTNPGAWVNGGASASAAEPVSYSTPHLSAIDRPPMRGLESTESVQSMRNDTMLAVLDAFDSIHRAQENKVGGDSGSNSRGVTLINLTGGASRG